MRATRDLVCAYKPDSAFYEAHRDEGIAALRRTIEYIHVIAPEVPIILDYKRGDIGNTNLGYVKSAFDFAGADAVTVSPYLGQMAMQPFLDRKDKGIFVLCRTSNDGVDEFHGLEVNITEDLFNEFVRHSPTNDKVIAAPKTLPLYAYVAERIRTLWNANGNCGLVVGATAPKELARIRRIVGDIPILIPGIGAQGGDLEATVKAGADSHDQGMIINLSRSVLYASNGPDFADAAREEVIRNHTAINAILKGTVK